MGHYIRHGCGIKLAGSDNTAEIGQYYGLSGLYYIVYYIGYFLAGGMPTEIGQYYGFYILCVDQTQLAWWGGCRSKITADPPP